MKRANDLSLVTERLAALAEPIRLRIGRLLEAEELTVGEVAKIVQLPQSTVSRHLKILAEGGWLARRNAATATLYRLVLDDLPPEARALWVTVRGQMAETPDLAEDGRRLAAVLADRRLDSQTFFGRVGGEWDAVRASLFGGDFTARAMLSLVPHHWTVADLGCGTGNASELLAPHVAKVVAVDQSPAMLDAARDRLDGQPNVEFATGDLERLPLADATVDAAVCFLVLHHVGEPLRAAREMRRILRSDRGGGVVLIVDMVEHDRDEYRQSMGHKHLGFGIEGIGHVLREAGFGGVRVDVLPTDPDAKGPALFAATGRIA